MSLWKVECQSQLFFRLSAWHCPYVWWPEGITQLKTAEKQFLSMKNSDTHSEISFSSLQGVFQYWGMLGMLKVLLTVSDESSDRWQYFHITSNCSSWTMQQLAMLDWYFSLLISFTTTGFHLVQAVWISCRNRGSDLPWVSTHWVVKGFFFFHWCALFWRVWYVVSCWQAHSFLSLVEKRIFLVFYLSVMKEWSMLNSFHFETGWALSRKLKHMTSQGLNLKYSVVKYLIYSI